MATSAKLDRIDRLCRMEQELATSTDSDEVLAKIVKFCQELADAHEASILLYDEDADELYFKQTMGAMGEAIKKVRVPLDKPSIAGAVLRSRKPEIINDVAADPRHFKGVDKVAKYPTKTMLSVPIVWGEKVFGVINVINKKEDGVFDEEDQELLGVLASHTGVVLNNVHLMEDLQNYFLHTVDLVVGALETLEPNSHGHITRVTRLATGMARAMGLSDKEHDTLYYAAYFHDVGKLILRQNPIPRDEKTHPEVGARMLSNVRMLSRAAPLVKHHHERYNGTGFPDRLKGEEIPLGARILALAEDFDEKWMVKPPLMSRKKFRETFFNSIGYAHDPKLMPHFVALAEKLY